MRDTGWHGQERLLKEGNRILYRLQLDVFHGTGRSRWWVLRGARKAQGCMADGWVDSTSIEVGRAAADEALNGLLSAHQRMELLTGKVRG